MSGKESKPTDSSGDQQGPVDEKESEMSEATEGKAEIKATVATELKDFWRGAIFPIVASVIAVLVGLIGISSLLIGAKVDGLEKSVNAKIDGVEKSVNASIAGLTNTTNARFDTVNTKIDGVNARFDTMEKLLRDIKAGK